ncbi:hypothetical protein ABEG90_12655 [Pantoea agglomerans]|uniref:hypothetical protein n=1 Tax=Enterobacter agglomerans TaxID=549 RepID=UPI0011CE3F94
MTAPTRMADFCTARENPDEWSQMFAGMAHFIREKNGMAYTLPADPVITDESGCPGECLVIDSRQVLRQPH